MNTSEVRFDRLLWRALLLSRLLPWAAFSMACGGSSIDQSSRDRGNPEAGGQANHGGAGGSATGGDHGDRAGNGGTQAGSGGSAGSSGGAGAFGGTGGVGGSGASAGSGGNSGSAGMGAAAGSGGQATVCHAAPPRLCGGGPITLPRSCVSDEMASAGTALPIATCQTMCQSMFTFSCSVSAVAQTSITVQCVTGCPLQP